MARPLRIEFSGAIYHITSRGNAQQTVFLDDADRRDFFVILGAVVERFNWILHAYCLMGNHYHFLVETPDGNLSKGMRQLNGVYTQAFNKKHNRVGHLMQGRYKAIFVDREGYLLALCRYIVLNPVRAGLVKDVQEWRWSSYRGTAGYENEGKISFLSTDWILSQFSRERESAINQYRKFVHEGLDKESPLKAIKGQIFLGEDNFVEKFKPALATKELIKEIPRIQRHITKPTLEELFSKNRNRQEAIHEAHVRWGYTLSEIGDFLGIHYTTVSRRIAKMAVLK